MAELVLLRHGRSEWNRQNRFAGWWDVGLAEEGKSEAVRAGQLIQAAGYDFDAAFASMLTRSIVTLDLALEAMDRMWLPVTKCWQLNERHYGVLTGQDKNAAAAEFGVGLVRQWRRSLDGRPPAMEPNSGWSIQQDRRYKDVNVPKSESLADTIDRVAQFWKTHAIPQMTAGRKLLICAHGTSLRALLANMSTHPSSEFATLEIRTGQPMVVKLDDSFVATHRCYLGEA